MFCFKTKDFLPNKNHVIPNGLVITLQRTIKLPIHLTKELSDKII